jgi:hypothetical protein
VLADSELDTVVGGTSWRKAMSLKSAFPHAPASAAAPASKGLGAASLLMVACETP